METTAQRNSRIAQDDSAAHSAFDHAKDFFNGLASYEISPSFGSSFSVVQKTPHGQRSTSAKNLEDALLQIEEWANSDICVGYSRSQFA